MFASELSAEIARLVVEHGDFEVIDEQEHEVMGVEYTDDDGVLEPVFVITVGS